MAVIMAAMTTAIRPFNPLSSAEAYPVFGTPTDDGVPLPVDPPNAATLRVYGPRFTTSPPGSLIVIDIVCVPDCNVVPSVQDQAPDPSDVSLQVDPPESTSTSTSDPDAAVPLNVGNDDTVFDPVVVSPVALGSVKLNTIGESDCGSVVLSTPRPPALLFPQQYPSPLVNAQASIP
jgi:hypothetical protein